MKLILKDNTEITLHLYNNECAEYVTDCIKHLQHCDIPWSQYDNPFQEHGLEASIQSFCKKHNITAPDNVVGNQESLNQLHKFYELADKDEGWHDFHSMIHRAESQKGLGLPHCEISYKRLGGPFEKPFTHKHLTQTHCNLGTLYLRFTELGKTPIAYWADQEPNDIERIKALAKPWVTLRPNIFISFATGENLPSRNTIQQFQLWWDNYAEEWCKHWNKQKYTVEDMCAIIPIGFINDEHVDLLMDKLKQNVYPKRLLLT